MNKDKEYCIMPRYFFEAICRLSKSRQSTIYNAVFKYSFENIEPKAESLDKMETVVWTLIKPLIDGMQRNGAAMEERSEGKRRGNPNFKRGVSNVYYLDNSTDNYVDNSTDNYVDNSTDNSADNSADNYVDNSADNYLPNYLQQEKEENKEKEEKKESNKERKEEKEKKEEKESDNDNNHHRAKDLIFEHKQPGSSQAETIEAETEPRSRSYAPKAGAVNTKDFIGFFNAEIEATNSRIPKIFVIQGTRRELLQARISQYGLETVKECMRKALRSDFLNGRTGANGATYPIDWLLKPNNFPKVLEGNYDSRETPTQTQISNANSDYYQSRRRTEVKNFDPSEYLKPF